MYVLEQKPNRSLYCIELMLYGVNPSGVKFSTILYKITYYAYNSLTIQLICFLVSTDVL